MTIWVFNDSNIKAKEFVYESLKNGISRFGWSWFDTANLRTLTDKSFERMSPDEQNVFKKASFLLGIRTGDWVVHINVPNWGTCTAAKVSEEYHFDDKVNSISDFRHCLKIEMSSLIEFNRNSSSIHPVISRKLKLRGRYWRLYNQEEFLMSIENLKNHVTFGDDFSVGVSFLKQAMNPMFAELGAKVHLTHPEKKLEALFVEIFKNVPGVREVKANGSGWGTDFGADIIVRYEAGLNILNLSKEETLVIQVKSYEGVHVETNAVDQIKVAIDRFDADAGLIITTAESSDDLDESIELLSQQINKPIALLAGKDVAKFLLKHEGGILLDI